jgi:hypothetical protein
MNIHNTRDWPAERLLKYGPEITAAMAKLVERFPNEVTLKSLAEDAISGRQQLWLILEGEEFRSFVLTEFKVTPATGINTVYVTALAGDDGVMSAPLIAEIEAWAKAEGATQSKVIGRWGWKRPLAREGYEMDAVVYRKTLLD